MLCPPFFKAAFEVRPYNLQELNVSSQAEEFNDKSEGIMIVVVLVSVV